MTGAEPLLTICTPTYERPALLRRALRSVTSQRVAPELAARVQLVVSDNSTSDEPREVAATELAEWPGPTVYVRNVPPTDVVENHDRCIALATGRYIGFLHDDDALLPGGLEAILDAISGPDAAPVHLFGVHVVDMAGRVRRRQVPGHDERLTPADALDRLLSDSSYVRIPALVVRSDAYRDVGPFDPAAANAMDLDMCVRLFVRHGLRTVGRPIAQYTVHEAALTTTMFTGDIIGRLMRIFERASASGLLDPVRLRRDQAAWFHKFILAGTWRCLERGDRAAAAKVMRLFALPSVRRLGPSPRWLPVRAAFMLATLGAGRGDSTSGRRDAS